MNNGPEQMEPNEAAEVEQLETALRQALRPVEPPAEFAHRLYARAILEESRKSSGRTEAPKRRGLIAFPRLNYAVGGALAAGLAVCAFVAESVHQRHERERAEAAEQQLEQAVRATNHAMEVTRRQLAKSGFQLVD